MTTKTRNSIKLNSKDLFLAADIASNSVPCAGSLKATVKGIEGGKEAAYCVMGCIAQAVATRRHISFKKAVGALYGPRNSTRHQEVAFAEALTEKLLDEPLDLTTSNDGFNIPDYTNNDLANGGYGFSDIQRARQWQVETLKELAKAAAKQEAK
jgi:hypothetical protein